MLHAYPLRSSFDPASGGALETTDMWHGSGDGGSVPSDSPSLSRPSFKTFNPGPHPGWYPRAPGPPPEKMVGVGATGV